MTEYEVDAIREMWCHGMTMRQIGDCLGYHYTHIGKTVSRLGLPKHYHHYTDDDVRRMREMRERGMSYREIGDAFGCNKRTAEYYLRVRDARRSLSNGQVGR